jgi:polar amino acid transport system substrate-binding protein
MMIGMDKSGLMLSRRSLIAAAGGLGLLPLADGAARAQTVAAIKQTGILKVGSQVAQVPWGFSDANGQLTGFDIELCRMLATDLGVKAEFTAVTPANRTAALLTGQVDVLAAVMGIFADRQKVVLFSRPYCNNDTVFIGKVGPTIKGWAEMKGLRVGVPRGTPQDIAITKAAPAGATIQRFDDDSTTVQALISGQVDMIGGASTQVVNIDKVAGPGKFEQKFVLARAYNAFAVRPDAREWADALSAFVAKKLESGELKALFKKWIGTDLVVLPTTGEGPSALPIVVTPA